MSLELEAALERARHHVMTPQELFEQRVSFVYGQQDYDSPNPRTKDEIRQMLAEMYGRPAPSGCVCPPGSEATCKGGLCPRRGIGSACTPSPTHPGRLA